MFYFQYQVFKRGKYNRFTAPYYRDPSTHYLEGRVKLHIVCRNVPMQGCILKHGYCKLSLDSLRREESILRGGQLRCDTHGAFVLLLLLQNTRTEQLREQSICSQSFGFQCTMVGKARLWIHNVTGHTAPRREAEMNSYTQLSFCFSFSLVVQSEIMAPNFRAGVLHLHKEMYLLRVSQSSQIKNAKYPLHMVTLGEVFLGIVLLFP